MRLTLWAAVAAATLLRLFCVVIPAEEGFLQADSPSYLGPAMALLSTGEYRSCPGCDTPSFRLPLYPAFVASVFSPFGSCPRCVVAAQHLIAIGSAALLATAVGLGAGQSFTSHIHGDESLSKRPMQRVMKPLAEMGATILATNEKFPPLEIRGSKLKANDYSTPVASAQVKTCVLFAGLFCDGETIVREPVKTRDHTELALRMFGADIKSIGNVITLQGRPRLEAKELHAPGDLSSSAFFLSAALMIANSNLVIGGVQAMESLKPMIIKGRPGRLTPCTCISGAWISISYQILGSVRLR